MVLYIRHVSHIARLITETCLSIIAIEVRESVNNSNDINGGYMEWRATVTHAISILYKYTAN